MLKEKHIILFVIQLISYCIYAENTNEIFKGQVTNFQLEILSKKRSYWVSLSKSYYRNKFSNPDRPDTLAVKQQLAQGNHAPPEQLIVAASPAKPVTSQPKKDRRGLALGLVYSFGYSAHASSYFEDKGFQIKEFSGFRIIVLDGRLGWGIHERMVVYSTWKFSPSNSTISPYWSHYQGVCLAYYLRDFPQLSIHGGLGKYRSKVGKDKTAGEGLLVNMGLALEFSDHATCELILLTGKMNPGNLDPDPFNPWELNLTLGIGYLF